MHNVKALVASVREHMYQGSNSSYNEIFLSFFFYVDNNSKEYGKDTWVSVISDTVFR